MSIEKMDITVDGYTITQLAREKFHSGNAYYAVKLLRNCLQSCDVAREKIIDAVYAILDGRAEIQGPFDDKKYMLYYPGTKEMRWDITDRIERMNHEINELQKEVDILKELGK